MKSANNSPIGVAVIGGGLRSRIARFLFDDGVVLRSIYDPDRKRAAERAAELGFPGAEVCTSACGAMRAEGVSWVMVFSPNHAHCQDILGALSCGCDVFSEKPLATSMEDCLRIASAVKSSGRTLFTGFVLRHAPVYRKIKEILDAGTLGKIISVEADNLSGADLGSYIMRNWRRLRANAGPYILEMGCHELDLLRWFIGAPPVRGASFGGLNYFVPEHREAQDRNPELFNAIPDPHGEKSPFVSDKDILDNQVAILEYASGARATLHLNLASAMPERRLFIIGTLGCLELAGGVIRCRMLGEKAERRYDLPAQFEYADREIMEDLRRTMTDKESAGTSGREGLETAFAALKLDQAQREGRVVDIREEF